MSSTEPPDLSPAVFLSRFVDLIVVVNLVDHGLWTTP